MVISSREDLTPTGGVPRVPDVPYMPGLDGLRALGVLAVIVFHANEHWLGGGFLGVEVFFVISGYLITSLLVTERQRYGEVSLGNFWLRRARRLLPALWTMMVGLVLWCAIFYRDPLGKLRGDFLAGATYVTNWFQIWSGSSYTTDLEFAGLRHLWSLAVEEQFYLVWPVVMYLVLRRLGQTTLTTAGLWFVTGSIGVTIFGIVVYKPGSLRAPEQMISVLGRGISRIDFLYLGSVTRASGLLLGAALAMFWRPWTRDRGRVAGAWAGLDAAALVALAALVAMNWYFRIQVHPLGGAAQGYDLLFRGGFFLVDLASVVVIAAVVHPRSVLGRYVVGNPVLRWVGTRSYGLYLYHWPVFQVIRGETTKTPLSAQQALGAALIVGAITELSYRFIETPIRRGQIGDYLSVMRYLPDYERPRMRRRVTILAVGVLMFPVYAGVALARAGLKGSSVDQSLDEGNNFTSTVLPPVTVPGGSTSSTAPKEVPAVLAVGDSVMLGAAQRLSEYGISVDAAEDRLFSYAEQIFNFLKSGNELSDTVVIHLGTNNGVSAGDLKRVMAPLAGVKQVVILNSHAPGKEWEAPTNAVLATAPSLYPNVRILDWKTIGDSAEGIFEDDKIHLTPVGQKFYADQIAEFLGLSKK